MKINLINKIFLILFFTNISKTYAHHLVCHDKKVEVKFTNSNNKKSNIRINLTNRLEFNFYSSKMRYIEGIFLGLSEDFVEPLRFYLKKFNFFDGLKKIFSKKFKSKYNFLKKNISNFKNMNCIEIKNYFNILKYDTGQQVKAILSTCKTHNTKKHNIFYNKYKVSITYITNILSDYFNTYNENKMYEVSYDFENCKLYK